MRTAIVFLALVFPRSALAVRKSLTECEDNEMPPPSLLPSNKSSFTTKTDPVLGSIALHERPELNACYVVRCYKDSCNYFYILDMNNWAMGKCPVDNDLDKVLASHLLVPACGESFVTTPPTDVSTQNRMKNLMIQNGVDPQLAWGPLGSMMQASYVLTKLTAQGVKLVDYNYALLSWKPLNFAQSGLHKKKSAHDTICLTNHSAFLPYSGACLFKQFLADIAQEVGKRFQKFEIHLSGTSVFFFSFNPKKVGQAFNPSTSDLDVLIKVHDQKFQDQTTFDGPKSTSPGVLSNPQAIYLIPELNAIYQKWAVNDWFLTYMKGKHNPKLSPVFLNNEGNTILRNPLGIVVKSPGPIGPIRKADCLSGFSFEVQNGKLVEQGAPKAAKPTGGGGPAPTGADSHVASMHKVSLLGFLALAVLVTRADMMPSKC